MDCLRTGEVWLQSREDKRTGYLTSCWRMARYPHPGGAGRCEHGRGGVSSPVGSTPKLRPRSRPSVVHGSPSSGAHPRISDRQQPLIHFKIRISKLRFSRSVCQLCWGLFFVPPSKCKTCNKLAHSSSTPSILQCNLFQLLTTFFSIQRSGSLKKHTQLPQLANGKFNLRRFTLLSTSFTQFVCSLWLGQPIGKWEIHVDIGVVTNAKGI